MSGTETFGAIAQRISDNGYRPLPIGPGQKRPPKGFLDWQTYRFDAQDSVTYGDHGVGIILGRQDGLVGVDIDVRDPATAETLDQVAVRMLGPAPRRVGQAPKCLRLYRYEGAAIRKMQTNGFRFLGDDREAKAHKVEILATGQQFVAFGVHPDTQKPYTWPDGPSPLVTPAIDLPTVTERQLAEFLAEAKSILERIAEPVVAERAKQDKFYEPIDELKRAYELARVEQDPRVISELRSALERIDAVDRDTWIRQAHRLRPLDELGFELFDEYSRRAPDKYDADDVHDKFWSADGSRTLYTAIFNEAAANGWKNPRKKTNIPYEECVDRTDVGNANLLRRLTAGNLRFVPERDMWLYWNGSQWLRDDFRSQAQEQVLLVPKHYADQAALLKEQAANPELEDADRKRLLDIAASYSKWEKQCRNRARITAMLEVTSRMPGILLPAAELDRDPYLLGVANGVVDLRTGELRPAGRDDYITKRSPIAYVPGAKAPRWEKFIEEIMGEPIPAQRNAEGTVDPGSVGRYRPRPDLVNYLQRRTGYFATGTDREQKFFIDEGSGSNGKDVLTGTIKRILGDYAVTLPAEALMQSKFAADAERPSPFLASLAGARFAHCSESKDRQKLDIAVIKRHTGGAKMAARKLHQNAIEFPITHKLVLATNHLPGCDHLDDAIRGRLHILRFKRTWNRPGHTERNPALPDGDKTLVETLENESEGILAWIVSGAVEYLRDGLAAPADVTAATQTYFHEQDALAQWLATMQRCAPRRGELASTLYTAFKVFCADEGLEHDYESQRAFSNALAARDVSNERTRDGSCWGLRAVGLAGGVTL